MSPHRNVSSKQSHQIQISEFIFIFSHRLTDQNQKLLKSDQNQKAREDDAHDLLWGIKATILFNFWKTDSWLSYILTLIACFVFSAFYQYLENRRVQFKSLSSSSSRRPPPARSSSGVSAPLIPKSGTRSAAKAASILLFGVNAAIGYLLMLAAMSFNGGVFIAIVAGLTVGYAIFRSDDGGSDAVTDDPCPCA